MATLVTGYDTHSWAYPGATRWDNTTYLIAAEWISASETMTLEQVKIWSRRQGDVGSGGGHVWMEVWNESGGAPNAVITNGTSANVTASTLTEDSAGAEVTFTWSTPPTLTSGNSYYFVLNGDWTAAAYTGVWMHGYEGNDSSFNFWEQSSGGWAESTNETVYIQIYKADASSTEVSATLDTLAVAGYDPTLSTDTSFTADADTLAVAGYDPTVTVSTSPAYEGNGGIAAVDANSSLDVPYPSSIAANDILILQLLSKTVDNHNAITDWTKVQEVDQGTNTTSSWYWKRATGSETGNLTCTRSSSTGAFFGVISRWSGCASTGTPFEQETYTSGQSTTFSSSAITPITNMNRIVCLACVGDDAALGTLAGGNYAENFEVNSSTGTDGAFSANSFAQTTAAEEVARSGSIS